MILPVGCFPYETTLYSWDICSGSQGGFIMENTLLHRSVISSTYLPQEKSSWSSYHVNHFEIPWFFKFRCSTISARKKYICPVFDKVVYFTAVFSLSVLFISWSGFFSTLWPLNLNRSSNTCCFHIFAKKSVFGKVTLPSYSIFRFSVNNNLLFSLCFWPFYLKLDDNWFFLFLHF